MCSPAYSCSEISKRKPPTYAIKETDSPHLWGLSVFSWLSLLILFIRQFYNIRYGMRFLESGH